MGGVFVLLLLVMDLNSRMVHMLQLRGERDAELAKVNDLLAKEADLDKKIEYALSDEIVEEWARNQNMMQQKGDFVVVVLPKGEPLEDPMPQVEEVDADLSNWESWKLWLSFQE
ncbi:hypothetical protein KQH54_04610 [bacterium]|nr:hypothetical protein [bacterium]MCB2180381.1 hypothetical protein [bacterium]